VGERSEAEGRGAREEERGLEVREREGAGARWQCGVRLGGAIRLCSGGVPVGGGASSLGLVLRRIALFIIQRGFMVRGFQAKDLAKRLTRLPAEKDVKK